MGKIAEQLSQALANVYCTKRHRRKVLDSDLITDMGIEGEKFILDKKPKKRKGDIFCGCKEPHRKEHYVICQSCGLMLPEMFPYNQALNQWQDNMERE